MIETKPIASMDLSAATGRALDELDSFVAIPNHVSDPVQIRANAEWLERALTSRGMTVRMLDTPSGRPVVVGDLDLGRARTTIVYSHYDGVGVNQDDWHSQPYRVTLRRNWDPEHKDWAVSERAPGQNPGPTARVFGRSVADSKNAIVAILTALDILREAGLKPASNIRLVLDGEEEEESPGLAAALSNHREVLDGDLFICASGELHQSGRPTVSMGVRGIMQLEISVSTGETELHSGHFGNFGRNAAMELAHILASLKNLDGSIAVEGLESEPVPLSPEERAAIAAAPSSEAEVVRKFSMASPESAGTLPELINRTTLNVRGIAAGGLGEAARNVIPVTATAEIDMRLTLGRKPEDVLRALEAHIAKLGYATGNSVGRDTMAASRGRVTIKSLAAFEAVRTPLEHLAARRLTDALRTVAGDDLLVQPTDAGSLNFTVFADAGLPVTTLPISNSDCNQHTADENLLVGTLSRGIELFTAVLAKV